MTNTFLQALARPVLATTLAASIALTPLSAAPARAGNDEAAAVAFGTIFALIAAGIISSNTRDGRNGGWTDGRNGGGRGGHDTPRLDPRKALPSQCDFTINRGRDRGTYYKRPCLVRNFNAWPRLPERCETRVERQNGRTIRAYEASCLTRYGYYDASDRRARRN